MTILPSPTTVFSYRPAAHIYSYNPLHTVSLCVFSLKEEKDSSLGLTDARATQHIQQVVNKSPIQSLSWFRMADFFRRQIRPLKIKIWLC
jgi:hypothetical protein